MAFVLTLTFDYEINTSLQVGDQVYHTGTSLLGGFEQNDNLFGGQIHIGVVQDILPPDTTDPSNTTYSIMVYSTYECTTIGGGCSVIGDPLPGIVPNPGDYISFSKNRIANNSDLLGYYASVKFINNSFHEAKLWAVGSEVTENSK